MEFERFIFNPKNPVSGRQGAAIHDDAFRRGLAHRCIGANPVKAENGDFRKPYRPAGNLYVVVPDYYRNVGREHLIHGVGPGGEGYAVNFRHIYGRVIGNKGFSHEGDLRSLADRYFRTGIVAEEYLHNPG